MDTQRFKDKIVIVTGSGQGIGKNIALAYGREGAIVIVAGVEKEKGRLTVNAIEKSHGIAYQIVVDLSKKEAASHLVKKTINKFGRVDVLVNNAKGGKRVKFLDETEASWEDGMSVTLRAAFFASLAMIKHHKSSGLGGAILNIASVAGLVAGHDAPVYHIAKAGMIHMTKYLAANAGKYGVRVNCVMPGFIVKDEHQERFAQQDNAWYRDIANFVHPLGTTGRSDDVASAVLFLTSSEASYITGACLPVDGGLTVQDQSNMVYRYHNRK